MANINKDYLVIADLKSSKVSSPAMVGYNTDKRIFNIFTKLQITMSSNPDIKIFVTKEEAINYTVKLTVIKPTTKQLRYAIGELMNSGTIGNGAVYQFDLGEEFTDQVGKYICELTVICTVNGYEELITCDPFTYTIKPSAVTGLNPELERTVELPILEHLIGEVQEVKKNIEEGTLSNYQTKTDVNLQTSNKGIVTAINELDTNKADKTEVLLSSKLNDNGTGADELWSASKVNAQFNTIEQDFNSQLAQTVHSNSVKINSSNTDVKFIGTGWKDHKDVNYQSDHKIAHYSNVINDYVEFTFEGTGIDVYDYASSNKGIVEVFIDGISQGTFDSRSATPIYNHKLFSVNNLTSTEHTIKIVITGNTTGTDTFFTIDYFEVINYTTEKLRKDVEKVASKINGFYWSSDFKNTLDVTQYTPLEFYQMIEAYKYTSHPYFTIDILGKDQSNQYDIRLYKYEPKGYEKTIFLTGAIHGWENFGTYAIIELFKMLLGSEDNLPPQFKYIKDKVRVLAIPVANPWGMYANPKTRQNSNGVDINRNFDWNWTNNNMGVAWDYDYKGTAPFSEKETQHVKKVFDTYRNISVYLDIHNQGYTNQWHYFTYPDDNMKKEFDLLHKYLSRDMSNPVIRNDVGYNDASANNYSSKVMNIPSATLEAILGAFGVKGLNKDNNKWLEYVLNSVIMACTHFANSEGFSVRNKRGDYLDGAVVLSNNIATDIADSVITFIPPSSGYVTVNGYLLAKQTNANDIFAAKIVLDQPGYLVQDSSYQNVYTKNSENPLLPLDISIPVTRNMPVNIKIVALNEGTGTCNIKRFNLNIVYQSGKDLGLFSPGSMDGYAFA